MMKIKTFHPNLEEFGNIKSLLESIVLDPECQKTGLAKVSCFVS